MQCNLLIELLKDLSKIPSLLDKPGDIGTLITTKQARYLNTI
jgi:hypothetical protein